MTRLSTSGRATGRRARRAPRTAPEARFAKIAATLGPACDDPKTLEAMLRAGVDVARLNFSHGTADDHRKRVRRLRRIERAIGRPVTVLADLQGPRFRIGRLPHGRVRLEDGESVVLFAGRETCDDGAIPVAYAALANDARKGDRVLFDDGRVELEVRSVRGDRVRCTVVRGGELTDRKGLNLPGGALSAPALTKKDLVDLDLAVELGADALAISFVRRPEDVRRARRRLAKRGSDMPILAKIERPEAIEDLDAILEASDGLLVARGDLGVEIAPERVPLLQKRIIRAAIDAGKHVMTATQMLDSMRESPRPTRAEASDVANAVIDGSSSLLLTGETAAGKYPVETIAMMDRIIREAEGASSWTRPEIPIGSLSVPVATSLAACRAAYDVGARYLATFTTSGGTAQAVARFRPRTPILAYTPDRSVLRRLGLMWGVRPQLSKRLRSTTELIAHLDDQLRTNGFARDGETVVVLSGFPVGVSGSTNLMTVHRVGRTEDTPG